MIRLSLRSVPLAVAVLLAVYVNNGEGQVRAEGHRLFPNHRVCPRLLEGPQHVAAARGPKAGDLQVRWGLVQPRDVMVSVSVTDGRQVFVEHVRPDRGLAELEGLPRGVDLDIAVALTREGHLVSTISGIRLLAIQTQSRYGPIFVADPSARTVSAAEPPAVTTSTVSKPPTTAPEGDKQPKVTNVHTFGAKLFWDYEGPSNVKFTITRKANPRSGGHNPECTDGTFESSSAELAVRPSDRVVCQYTYTVVPETTN